MTLVRFEHIQAGEICHGTLPAVQVRQHYARVADPQLAQILAEQHGGQIIEPGQLLEAWISPCLAKNLARVGVRTVEDLGRVDPDQLAQAMDVKPSTVKRWQARVQSHRQEQRK